MGQQAIWDRETGRLLLQEIARSEVEGLKRGEAIKKIRAKPPWNSWSQDTLERKYREARRHHDAQSREQSSTRVAQRGSRPGLVDRWISLLIQWGKATRQHPASMSAEQARRTVDNLIAVAAHHQRVRLDELFVHMERRIHWGGRQKIEWLRLAIARLAANPHDWPIPPTRRGKPDVTAGKIESYLRKVGEAHKQDIAAELGIPLTTAQTTLCSMERAKRIVRKANGVYALWTEGAASCVATDKAILAVLAKGQAGVAELLARTGKSEGAIHISLHRLKKKGAIVLTQRGKYAMYALARTAPPHVSAGDAIGRALASGSRMTLAELETVTGKKRGELWAALLRKEAKHEGVFIGQRGYCAAFELSPGH